MPTTEEAAVAALSSAIQRGDLEGLRQLLNERPDLATYDDGRTALHVVTDWPGYCPDGPAVVRLLVEVGADIEAPFGSIGTPLDYAIGYGCWYVARLLVERGARVDKLWHAAALGHLRRLQELMAADPIPRSDDVSEALWQAWHGGQRRTAEYLLGHGADINATVPYADGSALDTASGSDTRRDILATWLREQGARPADP